MSMLNLSNKQSTLENLIDGLDSRGLLVLQVLIGQKAMEVLALEKISATSLAKPTLIKP